MRKIIHLQTACLLLAGFILYSCSKDNSVGPINPPESSYKKLITIDTSNFKFELYSKEGTDFYAGYNEIGLKVFINGQEKKDNYCRFTALMHHLGGSSHVTPVKEKFYFDQNEGLYTGYACFIMISDSTSVWEADFNYKDETTYRKKKFWVIPGQGHQMRYWLDINTNLLYLITLIQPKNPVIGLNSFKCILHRTFDQTKYFEVDSAEMFIRPWNPATGQGSNSNINPTWQSNGIYEGKANFTTTGLWYVYDSIKYNGNYITSNPPLNFVFDVK